MRMTFDEPMTDVSEETPVSQPTKTCPFCVETILAAAVKCRHCGEFLVTHALEQESKKKWYHSTLLVIAAIATLGPLALPMVWTNPRYHPLVKIGVTMAVFALTVGLCYAMVFMYRHLIDQIQALGL